MGNPAVLTRLISDMHRSLPELCGVMIASADGIPIAHDFPAPDAERLAAMAATALGLSRRMSDQADLGDLSDTVIRGTRGYLVAYRVTDDRILIMSAPASSDLERMRCEARSASDTVNSEP